MRGLLLTILWVAALATLTPVASAQHTGVVLGFSGRGAGTARQVVVGAIDGTVQLERKATVESTARRLGADLSTPDGMTQVASELRISLFVAGEVSGSRRRQRVTVITYDGQGVEMGRREGITVRRGRAGRRSLEQAAVELVQEAVVELDRRADAQRQQELLADQREISHIDTEAPPEEEESSTPSELPVFVALLGVGGRNRNADIALDSGATRVYDSGFFPELSLRLISHPLAGSGGALAGIFAQLDLAIALGLKTTDDVTGDEFDTSALRFLLAAGYLAQVGSVYVGGSLGFGLDTFDLAENTVMSSADYSHLRIGLIGRVPVIDEDAHDLWFQLDAGLRLVLGTGELAPMFGESASATGFDVEGSFMGGLAMGLAYALRFGLKTYSLSFEGPGMMPADTAVDGTDTAIVITANIGYQLR